MVGVGFRAQHSPGLSGPDKPCRAPCNTPARESAPGTIPSIGPNSGQTSASARRRAPRTASAAHRVRALGGRQPGGQPGRHAARALLERDIVPRRRRRCSAGAWNGSVIAADPTLAAVERLGEMWERLRGDLIFPGGRLARAWNLLTRDDHLFSDEGLRAVIDLGRHPGDASTTWRCRCGWWRADLDTGEEVVFACGPLRPALLASAALPGLFPPVRFDGRVLVDGAVVDTVPLSHALAGPVDRIYVLNVSAELMRRPLRSPLDVAGQGVRDQPQAAFRARAAQRARERGGGGAPRARRRPRAVRLLRARAVHRRGASARRSGARRRRRAAAAAWQPPPHLVAPHRGLTIRSARSGTPRTGSRERCRTRAARRTARSSSTGRRARARSSSTRRP